MLGNSVSEVKVNHLKDCRGSTLPNNYNNCNFKHTFFYGSTAAPFIPTKESLHVAPEGPACCVARQRGNTSDVSYLNFTVSQLPRSGDSTACQAQERGPNKQQMLGMGLFLGWCERNGNLK